MSTKLKLAESPVSFMKPNCFSQLKLCVYESKDVNIFKMRN